MNKEQLQILASQLSCPEGETGIGIGNIMHETNQTMTHHSIFCLGVEQGNHILELGHGNGLHINAILEQAIDVSYQGLEISELMKAEANTNNAIAVAHQKANFALYDGVSIPFEDAFFDKILTVNTIYFWARPLILLRELYRVLKTGGKLAITFAHREFMETLPFVEYGFQLYDQDSIVDLLNNTDFIIDRWSTQREEIESKTGDLVERVYSTIVLKKC